MRGAVCAEQLRAQSVAVVGQNTNSGCTEGFRPVVTRPSTNQLFGNTVQTTGRKRDNLVILDQDTPHKKREATRLRGTGKRN